MPGLVRKLVIFAVADGLILQTYGNHVEQSQALRLEYGTAKISPWKSTTAEHYKKGAHTESHGVFGLLSIASHSFLISISRREQVAQILGKPIYVIKDVSIVPLSSKEDAEKAIGHANATAQRRRNSETSDTESSGDETDHYESPDDREEPSSTPRDISKPPYARTQSSVAQDVIGRKGQYGRFAAQWFSRAGWSQEKKRTLGMSTEPAADKPDSGSDEDKGLPAEEPKSEAPPADTPPNMEQASSDKSVALALLPKLLRTTRTLLSSRCFYFSYDVNLTRRLSTEGSLWSKPPTRDNIDQLYFWNRHLMNDFVEGGYSAFVLPVLQGFVGQREFIAQRDHKDESHTKAVQSLGKILEADGKFSDSAAHKKAAANLPQPFLLTIISRRSVKRSGLRYLRRGIDDEGNAANSVETEQILSDPTWSDENPIRSFLQIRGSIPLYFSQSPYAFKPLPMLQQSADANQMAFERHFRSLRQTYGDVMIALLVDKHGVEVKIGEEYQTYAERFNEQQQDKLGFEWFDFHAECRGMKFENVSVLVNTMANALQSQGETTVQNKVTTSKQNGVIRTNCMDCLDRTNVVQSAFGQHVLERDLREQGFEIDFRLDPTTQWFNTLWADNGDAISRQYAGTAALKGDFTRTRKRNYRGALNDLSLTLSRYYKNIVNDYFSQSMIDFLLGNVTSQVFDDFEATMMSNDPGVSIDRIRQNSIESCAMVVIQNGEDLIHGWAMLMPSLPNTLRTLPLGESVLLLTDGALYACKLDSNTLKVMSFERIDLRTITNIRYGAYVTAALTDAQVDEGRNVGIVVTYQAGKDSIIRVNTRSLQNSIDPVQHEASPGEPANLLSWLQQGKDQPDRSMAVKAIPTEKQGDGSLLEHVEHVAEEIQRAAANSSLGSPDDVKITIEQGPIISAADAKRRTGYLEHLGYQMKKLVWA